MPLIFVDNINNKNLFLSEEIFTKILFMLDGSSLHNARQVCQEWNSVIKMHVMGTISGRKKMDRILQYQWMNSTPSKLDFGFASRNSRYYNNPVQIEYQDWDIIASNHKFAIVSCNSRQHLSIRVIDHIDNIIVIEDSFVKWSQYDSEDRNILPCGFFCDNMVLIALSLIHI